MVETIVEKFHAVRTLLAVRILLLATPLKNMLND